MCSTRRLAGQRSPETVRSVTGRMARAAAVLAEHGDEAGVAHAEYVLATALASLGQIARVEAALDRALSAARRIEDRRRGNSVLALTPLAVLWGPSPVARASGRCLDVIRVLRITSWSAHVEAHALRCQAVLEALRDRSEASRRMLESAACHVHRPRAAGGPARPRAARRTCRDACRRSERGRGASSRSARRIHCARVTRGARARAAALLARALLDLDRLDEAESLADPSVGGDDLKATIGLLGVRAEVLTRRAEVEEAEVLARRAVELAAGTDALLDHADARLALSRVLVAAGRGARMRPRRPLRPRPVRGQGLVRRCPSRARVASLAPAPLPTPEPPRRRRVSEPRDSGLQRVGRPRCMRGTRQRSSISRRLTCRRRTTSSTPRSHLNGSHRSMRSSSAQTCITSGEPITTLGPHQHTVHRVISTSPEGSPSGPIDYRSICVSVVRSNGVASSASPVRR